MIDIQNFQAAVTKQLASNSALARAWSASHEHSFKDVLIVYALFNGLGEFMYQHSAVIYKYFMRYDDLIYDPLMEAKLSPGEVKAIELKIDQYEDELAKLKKLEMRYDDMFSPFSSDFPKELEDKIEAYRQKYTQAIADLKEKLKQDYPMTKFDNFMAGIKKNCKEILSYYQRYDYGTFFYSGFKNAKQSALYGKPPAEAVFPSSYAAEDFRWLTEERADIRMFDNALLANSDAYYATSDDRNAYMIFPRDGFKYFYLKGSENMNIDDSRAIYLFDKDEMARAWEVFVGDESVREKFLAAGAELYYPEKGSIGAPEGFMGRYTWRRQLRAIDRLAEQGIVDDIWGYHSDWKNWVSKATYYDYFKPQINTNLEYALRSNYDVIIQTSGVYAINAKYRIQVEKALRNS